MTGSNELILNTATIMTAVKFYLDSKVFVDGMQFEVKSIAFNNSNDTYCVRLTSPVEVKPGMAVKAA